MGALMLAVGCSLSEHFHQSGDEHTFVVRKGDPNLTRPIHSFDQLPASRVSELERRVASQTPFSFKKDVSTEICGKQ